DSSLGYFFGIFVGDAISTLFVGFGIRWRPPVTKISLGVEFTAFIVKAVRDLVADYRADRAVVHRIFQIAVEKWWLQDPGRKVDGIQLLIVVGVDRGRRHAPLRAIDRLSNLSELAIKLERCGLVIIDQIAGARNLHRGVIAPVIGIPDLVFNSVQLDFRLSL